MSRVLVPLVTLVAIGCAPTEAPEAAVAGAGLVSSYPIEVLGPPGTERTVSLPLTDDDLALDGDANLVLVVHNVVAPGSAFVSINGEEAIDLAESGALLRPQSGIARGSLAIDRAALRAGANLVTFRFEAVPIVSGFRVLDIALSIGDRALPLALPQDDPASWKPIQDDAASIERGRAFFQEVSRDGGPTCARCHTRSGVDLQYFAMSNHSIIDRAKRHLFPPDEAADMASYIRSLEVPYYGSSFEPPFQPGPDSVGPIGAGTDALLADDESFAALAFGEQGLTPELPWDWAADIDTFRLATPVQLTAWQRWLPRSISDAWFSMEDGALAAAEETLHDDPSLLNANRFLAVAVEIGKQLLVESEDHGGRIELLRFAAVKLWDWSRRSGFDEPDHGFVDGDTAETHHSPAYPYEVGFAFFEAGLAEVGIDKAFEQAYAWWWGQLALHPGRGLSNGERPLDYRDVLLAAELAGAGPAQIAFLHLYGSWEESRGALADTWGTGDGPVRLLEVALRNLPAAAGVALMARFLRQEAAFVARGGALDDDHLAALGEAWSQVCSAWDAADLAALIELAPEEAKVALEGCG